MNHQTPLSLFIGLGKFAKHIVLSSLMIFVVGCSSEKPYQQTTGTVAVKIPVVKNGAFTLDVVQLLGITNLLELEGKFARFFFSPRIEGGRLHGMMARTRFIEAGGVQVPADQLSAEMAAIYYHLQSLAQLDDEVGAKGVNTWPRSVGVLATIIEKNGKERTNNALYDGMSDSITLVPYVSENIPVSLNPGVIAHEHFHSLFFKLVMHPLVIAKVIPSLSLVSMHAHENPKLDLNNSLSTTPNDDGEELETNDGDERKAIYNWFFLKSLNEGLADVWGWAYTGQPDFIAFSLPDLTSDRTLNSKTTDTYYGRFPTAKHLREHVVANGMIYNEVGEIDFPQTRDVLISNYVYDLGVVFSRFFKGLADVEMRVQQTSDVHSAQAVTTRKDVLKIIIKILPMIRQKMRELKPEEYFDPKFILEMVAEADANLTTERCQYLASFMEKTTDFGAPLVKYSCSEIQGKIQLKKSTEADQ